MTFSNKKSQSINQSVNQTINQSTNQLDNSMLSTTTQIWKAKTANGVKQSNFIIIDSNFLFKTKQY